MATSQLNTFFQHLRRIVLIRDGAGLTDRQLLESFISQHDEAAFEALVRRLGPMVLKVCRRVVGNHHDAEDAFQATFLVLARKASSVKSRDMLANWLHGVALRTALKARTLRLKTQARERHVSSLPEPEAATPNDSHALKPLLDQELSRLAEIYRLPILLCNLEGKSIKETAQQLGWPQGTVAGRLARGKIILAKRLAQHGLATTAGVTVLENSLSACVPPSLVAATVKAASVYAAGKSAATGMIAANVAVLMEGVMKAMFFTKIKIAAGLLVVAATVGVGSGVLSRSMSASAQTVLEQGANQLTESKTVAVKHKTAQTPAPAMTDWERIQGIWELVSEESEGKARKIEKTVLMVYGKAVCIQTAGDGDIMVGLHLDPSHDPKTFELVMNTQTREGIYELDGDTLRLCGDMGHEPKRPTRFATEPGSHQSLEVFKRLHGREAFPYRRADGSTTFPEIVARRKSDHDKLRGTWRVVEAKYRGRKTPLQDSHWSIGKEKIVMNLSLASVGKSERIRQEATYHFWGDGDDAAPSPININMTVQMPTESPHAPAQETYRGVFALDGDTLKLCLRQRLFGKRTTEIPTSTSEKEELFILVLQRETAAPTTDAEKMQGDWRFVGEEANGKQNDDSDDSATGTFSFVGDLMICGFDVEQETVFKLDSAKSPKHITAIYKSNGVERKMLGIYSLNGDDMKICFQHVEKEGPRPDAFTTVKASGWQVFMLKRMKPAAEAAAPPQVPRVIDASNKPARANRVADRVDGGGQGILIALYDELKSGCLDLKKAKFEIWAQEVKDGRIIRPVIIHRDGQGRNEVICMADEGELQVDWVKGTLAIALFKVVIITRNGAHAYCEYRSMLLGSIDDVR